MEFKITRDPNYLEHHGIFGQKWGKKNGPPYPLDYEDHSASEKKKNPKTRLDNYGKSIKANISRKTSKPIKFIREHKNDLAIGSLSLLAAGAFTAAGIQFIKNKNLNEDISHYQSALSAARVDKWFKEKGLAEVGETAVNYYYKGKKLY